MKLFQISNESKGLLIFYSNEILENLNKKIVTNSMHHFISFVLETLRQVIFSCSNELCAFKLICINWTII